MTDTIQFEVQSSGERIDKLLLAHVPEISRAAAQRMIRAGLVTVDGEQVKPNYRLRGGERVDIRLLAEKPFEIQGEPIPIDLVYEDEFFLVVNKPAGMVVHPAFGHNTGTLVNAVLARVPDMLDQEQPERPGIVHRLDKDTSGLIVVAKDPKTRDALQEAFRDREVKKFYLTLVDGQVAAGHGMITASLGRDPQRRKRIAVVPDGRPAVTEYHVLERFERHTYLEVQLHTGRTHQIRVHLAYIGYPVVGDSVYGYRKQRVALARQFLHAARLVFQHPFNGQVLDLSVPLPEDLQEVLDGLRIP